MAIELSHCPFCNGRDLDSDFHKNAKNRFQAGCYECGATGPEAPTQEEAAELWNERALVPPVQIESSALNAKSEMLGMSVEDYVRLCGGRGRV